MWYRWAAVCLWCGAILAGSLLPGRTVAAVPVGGFDKLAHLVMYAVLAALAHLAVRRPVLGCAVLVAVVCGALSCFVELAQFAIPGRSPSAADAVAGLVGGALASATFVFLQRRRARQQPP
jgi:VanZ family protein